MLVYSFDVWSILLPFGIFCGHLVYFMVIWFIFYGFGTLYQENLATGKIRTHTKYKHVLSALELTALSRKFWLPFFLTTDILAMSSSRHCSLAFSQMTDETHCGGRHLTTSFGPR
jgi:hypothetical protein